MGAIDDVTQAMLAPQAAPQEPTMGDILAKAREQLATQPQRFPASYNTPEADEAAMQPETYASPLVTHVLGSLARPLVTHVLGSLARLASTPGRVMTPNPYPAGSEEGIEFERTRQQAIQDAAPQMASMVTLGAGAVPAEANALRMGIKAYHGSPHDFDAFSLDKIGTGEGAQAYGHGLYFAEAEPTAKAYRDQLSYMNKSLNGQRFYGNESPAHGMLSDALDAGTGIDGAIAKAQQTYQDFTNGPNPSYRNAQTAKQALEQLQEWKSSANIAHDPGKMYEVQINADPEHFLDWDKPLSEQPKANSLFENRFGMDTADHKTAADAVRYAGREIGDPSEISAALRDAGIPGIKYLDQGSRGAGEGSRNYVVFDDKLIDILRKYGMGSMAALPPGIAALAQPQQEPQ